jgi:hypothetical protein
MQADAPPPHDNKTYAREENSAELLSLALLAASVHSRGHELHWQQHSQSQISVLQPPLSEKPQCHESFQKHENRGAMDADCPAGNG